MTTHSDKALKDKLAMLYSSSHTADDFIEALIALIAEAEIVARIDELEMLAKHKALTRNSNTVYVISAAEANIRLYQLKSGREGLGDGS